MYFPDLSHYVYGQTFPERHIFNIGWLSLYRGKHACEFCPEPPKKRLPGGIETLDYPAEILGNGEIRVRALDGKIYVAPVLIYHYIVCHEYLPPRVFIDAVAADLPPPVVRDGVWR